jgi:hypothetical protein
MYDLKWRDCYNENLVKLISITRKVKQWLIKEHKTIAVHLDFCGVILEAQLSSPVMGLFANLVSLDEGLGVLDRFMWYGGEQGILEIIKNTF